jgi:hypothetical protein
MNEYQVIETKINEPPIEASRLYEEAYTLFHKEGDVSEVIRICKQAIYKIEKAFPALANNRLHSKLKSLIGFSYEKLGEREKATEAFKDSLFFKLRKTIDADPKIFDVKYSTEGSHDCYSFRSVKKHLLDDLIKNEITVSSPKTFNDPVDYPIFSVFRRLYEKNTPIEEAYRFLKIRCFVSNYAVYGKEGEKKKSVYNNTSAEFKNTLMWSHYANDHKGVCVKYKIKGSFLHQNSEEGIFSEFIDVDYKDNFKDFRKDSFSSNEAFAIKNSCWEYENEVRLLHYDPNCEKKYKGIPLDKSSCIEAVYFGLKCIIQNRKRVRKILGEEVAYFQMKEDDEDIFKLVEVPLNQKAEALLAAAAVAVTASVMVG